MLSNTHKRSIVRLIKKIEESAFEENDIKLLLIEIRDLIKPASFTTELAHFIAHPERNQGMCYQDLNLRALVIKRIVKPAPNLPPLTAPQDVLVINRDLFEVVFGIGITKFGEAVGAEERKKNGFNEKALRAFVNNAYSLDKKKGTYTLKNPSDIPQILNIIHNCTAFLSSYPLTTASDMINQLNNDVRAVFKHYIPDHKYNDSILKQANDITVCIFCLFQDSQFHVFDGSRGYLAFSHDDSEWSNAWNPEGIMPTSAEEELELVTRRFQNARLSLMLTFEVEALHAQTGVSGYVPMSSPFIPSDILLGDYFDHAEVRKHAAYALERDSLNPYQMVGRHEALTENVSVGRDAAGKLMLFKCE